MTDPQNELAERFEDRAPNSDSEDNSSSTGNTNSTGNASNTGSKPGPDPDDDATRNKKQVPMYLTEEEADVINGLYERLDAKSKLADNGAIEKHRDFMSEVVKLAADHEDDLAERLGIEIESV